MRHLGSIILSLILTALVYVLTGIGGADWLRATVGDTSIDYPRLGVGMLAILVAGLLYAVLTLSRLSPLGPVLSGLALFGVAMWATFANSSFTKVVPENVLGVSGAGGWVAGPVGALLAVPLIATIVSPRRWRRWANPPAAVAPAYSPGPSAGAAFPPATAYQPPASFPQQPSSGAPYASVPSAPPVYPPPPSSVGTTAAAWPAPATSDELTDPDATRRL